MIIKNPRSLCYISLACLCVGGNIATAQTITKHGSKFGLNDENGKVILEAKYDTVIGYRDAPTFFVAEVSNKFLYTYYFNWDSLNPLPENQRHWYISELEYDSVCFLRGTLQSDESQMQYSGIGYRMSGLWGIIYAQSYTASGNDFWASDYICCLGKQYKLPAKYERILDRELDYFYTTYLDGKYGLWNPLTGEEYSPEFDTIPIYFGKNYFGSEYGDRLRYVRKNGKWGVIRMDKNLRKIKYIAPCQYNRLEQVNKHIHASVGYGDTLMFFFTNSDSNYMPTNNGVPILFRRDSAKVVIYLNGDRNDSKRDITVKFGVLTGNTNEYSEIYYIDTLNKSTTSYCDTAYLYSTTSSDNNGLVYRRKKHPDEIKLKYEFFNINTAEFRFSFFLDSAYRLKHEFVKQKSTNASYRVERFYYRDTDNKERTIGYYSHTTQKFTRKKPKC